MRQIYSHLKDMSAAPMAILVTLVTLAVLLTWRTTRNYYVEREKIRRQYREPVISIITAVAIILFHKLYTKIKRERDQRLSWQKAGHQKSRTLKDRMASARET